MRLLALLALLVIPAAALAQPIPAPGARSLCTDRVRIDSGPHRTEPMAERAARQMLEAELTGRHGANGPYTLRGGLAGGDLRTRCAQQAGRWSCQIGGRICAPSLAVPLCAQGALQADALGDRDMCVTATSSSAGIATPTCPQGYALATARGADACRIR
jgi:hypothetical protein